VYPFGTEMCGQVDHHAAALDAGNGHLVDAQRSHAGGGRCGRAPHSTIRRIGRSIDVLTASKTVVVDDLRFTVTVRVEQRAHVAEAVPLRAAL
jgi:hypothetical protein